MYGVRLHFGPLRSMSDSDILGCAEESDGIIAARHLLRTNYATKVKETSNTVLLTFNCKTLPVTVCVGYERFPVALYVPNPLHCFRCQSYGHHKAACTATAMCAKCGVSGHDNLSCDVVEGGFRCVSCAGGHPSWSRLCPKFVSEKKVCEYRVLHDVSYYEARRVVLRDSARSYSAVVAKSVASVCTQTPLSFDCKVDLVNFPGTQSVRSSQSTQSDDSALVSDVESVPALSPDSPEVPS